MAKKIVKKKKKHTGLKIFAALVVILIAGAVGLGSYMLTAPDREGTDVTVEIPYGTSVYRIAQTLEEKGLIRNSYVFRAYVKCKDIASEFKSGTYTLNTSMDVATIAEKLMEGVPKETMMITIKEGMNIYREATYLESTGLFTAQEFLDEIKNNFDYYRERYEFLRDVPADREYKLEGYLSGDTFEVYVDATPRDVITKMLDRFQRAWKDEYYARCEELGFTVDQIVILASVIEREGQLDSDLPYISGVFYNRLKAGDKMGSQATWEYTYEVADYFGEKRVYDTKYNTYKYTGLPIGPIANCRDAAIRAALYPAETDYYFFVAKGDGTGETAFAVTYSEFLKLVEKYRDNWD